MFSVQYYKGPTVSVRGRSFLAGAGRQCSVVLEAPDVDEIHCKVSFEGDQLYIEDQTSTAGTRLSSPKNDPIQGRVALAIGQWIILGKAAFRVLEAADPDSAERSLVVFENLKGEEDIEAILERYRDRASLLFVNGPHEGRRVFLGDRPTTIGTSQSMDLVLNDFRVASKHARIEEESGSFWLSPLTEGVQLEANGLPVAKKSPLHHGSALRLGTGIVVFLRSEQAENGADPMATAAKSVDRNRFVLPDAVLNQERIIVGRSLSCDLSLEDRQLAPEHLRITFAQRFGDGRTEVAAFEAEDLSGGRTKLNGVPFRRQWLGDGDVIALGRHELRVKIVAGRCVLQVHAVAIDPEVPSFVVAGAGAGQDLKTALRGPANGDLNTLARARPKFTLQAPSPGVKAATAAHTAFKGKTVMAPQLAPRADRLSVLWQAPWDVLPSPATAALVGGGVLLTAAVLLGASYLQPDALTGRGVHPVHEEVAGSANCTKCHAEETSPLAPKLQASGGGPWMKDGCLSCHAPNKSATPDDRRSVGLRAAHQGVVELEFCSGCHGEHRGVASAKGLISSACALCHTDRHRTFFPARAGPGRVFVEPKEGWKYSFYADLDLYEGPGHVVLHTSHSTVEGRCRACHEVDGVPREEGTAYGACAGCHGGAESFSAALASAQCADCHREHSRGPPPMGPDRPGPAVAVIPVASTSAVVLVMGLGLILGLVRRKAPHASTSEEEDPRLQALKTAPEQCPGAQRGYAKKLPLLIPTDCVGSGKCVEVCPYKVLKMEQGKPIIVAAELCHECGLCVDECNFNALTMAEVGSEPKKIRVPALSADYETGIGDSQTGLYVIGAAAKVAMVKNASNLGAWVINHMVQVRKIRAGLAKTHGYDYEVIILGSGPGGMSAAIIARREGLSCVVLEPRPMPLTTIQTYGPKKWYEASPPHVTNVGPFELESMYQPELLRELQAKIDEAQIEIRHGVKVGPGGISRRGPGYAVATEDGTLTALRVVVAIGGGEPRRLGKGVDVDDRADVRYAIIDGPIPTGKNVVVNGAGNMALEVAAQLVDESNHVTLVYRKAKLSRASKRNKDAIEKLESEGRLTFLRNRLPKSVGRTHIELHTTDEKGTPQKQMPAETVACDVLYCLTGQEPPYKWLESMGLEITERSQTADIGRTDQPEFMKKQAP